MHRYLLAAAALAVTAAAGLGGAPEYFKETEADFGVSAIGPVLVHYFPITNTSKDTVTMGTPTIECGCVSASLLKSQLAPGETTYLAAYMNTAKIPTHQIGTVKTVGVRIPFQSPTLEEVRVKVTTVARPDLVLSKNEGLAFGTVAKGKTPTAAVKVTLFGNGAWEVKEAKSSGRFVKAEAKLVSRTASEVTYEVSATLTEDCEAGNWMTEVTLGTNAGGVEKLRIPLTVTVVSPIAVSPSRLSFEGVPAGGSSTKEVTVMGQLPFKVLEVKGGDATLSVTSTTEGSKTLHKLKVELKGSKAGEQVSRQITLVTDSKDMPTVVIPVSATIAK